MGVAVPQALVGGLGSGPSQQFVGQQLSRKQASQKFRLVPPPPPHTKEKTHKYNKINQINFFK